MTRNQRLVLVASILGSFVAFLDMAVVNVALPAIRRELGGGISVQQWVVDAYLLALGSLILIAGSLSDLFGRKRVFAGGLIGFAVASLLCAAAPHVAILILARGLQGVAGALLLSNFGVLSASAAGSHSDQGNGHLLNLGFERSARWLSFGAHLEYASPEFTRLGLLQSEAIPRLKSQVFAIMGLGRAGSLSISRTQEDYRDSRTVQILSARDSINIGGLGYLTLSVLRSQSNTRDTMIALSLTHSVNARTIASATTTSDTGGTGTELDLQRSLPAGRGIGYRVIADTGETRAADATLDLQGDVGTYEIEARRQSGAPKRCLAQSIDPRSPRSTRDTG